MRPAGAGWTRLRGRLRASDRTNLIRIMPAKGVVGIVSPGTERAGNGAHTDVIVVGAGLIGLVTAWRAAQRGFRVTACDPGLAHAAWSVAAGMLTPATEAAFGEEPLMRLGVLSRERYPGFAAEVEAASGLPTGFRPMGTLQVAFDRDDLAGLDELRLLQERLGLTTERLTGRECRRVEPMLAPAVRGGILAPDDHSVDPRLLTAALRTAASRAGVVFRTDRVSELLVSGGTAVGVRSQTGDELRGEQIVLAAGCWSAGLGGLPEGLLPALRPVKGQLLRLRLPAGAEPVVRRTVRGLVHGTPVYLVPREDGGLVLGATQEELGFDTRLTVEGVWRLLRDANELVPGLGDLEIVEPSVGLRPGSPDNGPLLGPTRLPGLHTATGHHRHGVLLAPITGDAMAEALSGGRLPAEAVPFAADRFAAEPVGPRGRDRPDTRKGDGS